MSKLWLVALHEYKRQVFQRGFILIILSLPLLIAFTIGLGILATRMRYNGKAVGYVDYAGWLMNPIPAPSSSTSPLDRFFEKPVPLIRYATEEAARAALDAGEIQAYYVFPADYPQISKVELVYVQPPGKNATQQFMDFVRINLLSGYSPDIAHRAAEGAFLTVRTPDGSRVYLERAQIAQVLPLFASIAFMILFASSSSTLVQAVVEEKENRTIEVLVTSVSPNQLMGGKVLGIVGMGLTQFLSWGVIIALGASIAGRVLGLEWVQQIRIPPRTLWTLTAAAIPSYILYCALMTALGATVADAQESQQLSALYSMSFALPFWMIQMLIEHPESLITIGLTLFPLTALASLCLRTTFQTVPLWQIGGSIALLTLCALGCVWLAARAFRLGMLRYGQRVHWRELLHETGPQPRSAAKPADGRQP